MVEQRTKARLVLFGLGAVGFVMFVLVARVVIANIHPEADQIVPDVEKKEEDDIIYQVKGDEDLKKLDKQLFKLSANAVDMKEIILVTGGSGFICSHFVDLALREGYQVIVMDRTQDPTLDGTRENWKMKKGKGHVPSFIHVYGDVTNKADLDLIPNVPIHYVFHCAGDPPPRNYFTNYTYKYKEQAHNEYDQLHVESTKNLLQLFETRDFPVTKFMVMSTTDIYGPLAKNFLPFSKMKNHPHPPNPWAASKLKMEKYIHRTWRNREHIRGQVIIRPTTVYGPRQQEGLVADLMHAAVNNKPMYLPSRGQYTRDMLFINDLVEAIYSAMLMPTGFLEVNVGSKIVVSLDELAQTIQKVTKSSSTIVHTSTTFPYIINQMVDDNVINPKNPVSLEDGLKITLSLSSPPSSSSFSWENQN